MRRRGVARELPKGAQLRPETLAGSVLPSIRAVARRPRAFWWALRTLLGSPRFLPRNAVVTPAAFAIAAELADGRPYDHIHAHWLTHTSTFAMLLSELTDTPFSITGHRWDVYEENLFPAKVHRAAFIRFIARACREAFEQRTGASRAGWSTSTWGSTSPSAGVSRDTAGGPAHPPAGRRRQPVTRQGAPAPDRGVPDAAAGTSVCLDIFGEGPEQTACRAGPRAGLEGIVRLRGTLREPSSAHVCGGRLRHLRDAQRRPRRRRARGDPGGADGGDERARRCRRDGDGRHSAARDRQGHRPAGLAASPRPRSWTRSPGWPPTARGRPSWLVVARSTSARSSTRRSSAAG